MPDKETDIEKAKRELQEYYNSPREKAKLANRIKEINKEFEEKLIGETTIWIESSLDKIKEEPFIPSLETKPDKYVRSQNKPPKEERAAYKKTKEKVQRETIKINSLSTSKLSMPEVIEILRFDNNNVLWNRDLVYWTERDWKELMQIKEKHMPTINKALNELENENIIEKNVIYNKPNENYDY